MYISSRVIQKDVYLFLLHVTFDQWRLLLNRRNGGDWLCAHCAFLELHIKFGLSIKIPFVVETPEYE